MDNGVLTVGKADYKPVLKSEGGSSGQGVESACRLFGYLGVITNQRGASVNQSRSGGRTKY